MYSRYYLLVGRLCDSINGTDTKSKVESESAPLRHVLFPIAGFTFLHTGHMPWQPNSKIQPSRKLIQHPPQAVEGSRLSLTFPSFDLTLPATNLSLLRYCVRMKSLANGKLSTSGSEPYSDLASEVQDKILIAGQLSELIRNVRSLQNLNVGGVWAMRGAKLCTSRIALSVSR